jgi:hypothetical protein
MKEDKNIDKLIRDNLRFEQGPEGLTDKIMGKIEAAEHIEEKALRSLMSKHVLESPSADFASNVMAQIGAATASETLSESETHIVTNPVIIGKRAWAVIATALIGFILYVMQTGTASEATPNIYEGLMSKTGDFFSQMSGSVSYQLPELLRSPLFAISLFALSFLLLLEHFFRYNRISAIRQD